MTQLDIRELNDPSTWNITPVDITPGQDKDPLKDIPDTFLSRRKRVEALILVRESCKGDRVLFEGMFHQTLASLEGRLPGVETVRKWGIKALYETSAVRDKVHIEEITEGSSRAVLFLYEGILYLLSEGSAHESDAHGNNGFTTLLSRILREHRPRQVWAAQFSRLVRNTASLGITAGWGRV